MAQTNVLSFNHPTLSRPTVPESTLADLATSDVGRTNRIYSEDEILVIQSVVRDAEQLLEEYRDSSLIARCKVALAPHRKLPEDVLRCIFAFSAQEGIHFPFQRSTVGKPVVPAAVLLSHVCSLWRRIVLSSPELWNNISLKMNNCDCSFLPCALELLSRAHDLPMNVELTVTLIHRHSFKAGDHNFNFGDAVYQLTSNRIIQILRLTINTHDHNFPQISPGDVFAIGTFDHVHYLDLWLIHDSLLLPVFSQSSFQNLEGFFTAERAEGEA